LSIASCDALAGFQQLNQIDPTVIDHVLGNYRTFVVTNWLTWIPAQNSDYEKALGQRISFGIAGKSHAACSFGVIAVQFHGHLAIVRVTGSTDCYCANVSSINIGGIHGVHFYG
jgi:hypothetical protein